MKITEGQKAPDFELTDQNGVVQKLSSYKGSWVLLFFYPKDFTPGCTKQVCNLRDNFDELSKYTKIIGISIDSSESHKRFIQKHELSFPLLSDTKKEVIKLYDSSGLLTAKRNTFLINPEGNIEKIYLKVSPTHQSEDILEFFNNIS